MHKARLKERPHPRGHFPCPDCPAVRTTAETLLAHVSKAPRHRAAKNMCIEPGCGLWFSDGEAKRDHREKAHGIVPGRKPKGTPAPTATAAAAPNGSANGRPAPKPAPAPVPSAPAAQNGAAEEVPLDQILAALRGSKDEEEMAALRLRVAELEAENQELRDFKAAIVDAYHSR